MHIVGPLISALLSCISALTPASHPLCLKTAENPYLLELLKTKDIGLFLRIAVYPSLLILMVPGYMTLSFGIFLEFIAAAAAAFLNHELCLVILNNQKCDKSCPSPFGLCFLLFASPTPPIPPSHEHVNDRRTGFLQE